MILSNVTPDDIETEIGHPLTSAQTAQVTRWIADAELLINNRLGAERMADLSPALYAMVVRAAVVRRLERATIGSATSITTSVDDASSTKRWEERGSDGSSWFLPEWWDLLDRADSSAFSTRPTFTPGRAGDGPHWWGYEVGNWSGPDIA